jgi:hypothetical protein
MVRLGLIFGAALAFVAAACSRADATLCTIPYTFTTGATIQAAPFNANFAALQTCGNAIDNSNIGSAGIYASQIIPTTVGQATFGGSQTYTFANGLNVTGAVVTTSSITAGTLLVTDNGATNVSGTWIQMPGNTGSAYPTLLGANSGSTTSTIAGSVFQMYNQTTGIVLGIDASGNLGVMGGVYSVGVTSTGAITSTGTITGLVLDSKANGSVAAPVGPGYNHSGTALGSGYHHTIDTTTITTSGSCTAYTACVITGGTITLTSPATFTSSTSYSCGASISVADLLVEIVNSSGSAIAITAFNKTGGTISNGTNYAVNYNCSGT